MRQKVPPPPRRHLAGAVHHLLALDEPLWLAGLSRHPHLAHRSRHRRRRRRRFWPLWPRRRQDSHRKRLRVSWRATDASAAWTRRRDPHRRGDHQGDTGGAVRLLLWVHGPAGPPHAVRSEHRHLVRPRDAPRSAARRRLVRGCFALCVCVVCLRHVPDPPCPRFTYLPGFLSYALKWPADGGTASRVTAPNSSGVRRHASS